MTKEKTTIQVTKDTRKDLNILKIRSDAKNIDATIRLLIGKLQEELKQSDLTATDVFNRGGNDDRGS